MEQTNDKTPVTDAKTILVSCDETISRKQFIDEVVKRGVKTGAILVGAVIVDKFVVPPAYASTSGVTNTGPILAPTDAITGPKRITDSLSAGVLKK